MSYFLPAGFDRKAARLNDVRHHPEEYPGWQAIVDASTTTSTRSLGTLASKAARLFNRNASPESLAAQWGKLDSVVRLAAQQGVSNTVGFAKNVLEAERDANFRGAILGFDLSDLMPTGPHYEVKQRAKGLFDRHYEMKGVVQNVLDAREVLPYPQRGQLALTNANHPLFLGYAELFGMARAGIRPGELNAFFLGDVVDVNHRTKAFWATTDALVDSLRDANEPAERLDAMRVSLPDAILVADDPTPQTVLNVASNITKRIAEDYRAERIAFLQNQ